MLKRPLVSAAILLSCAVAQGLYGSRWRLPEHGVSIETRPLGAQVYRLEGELLITRDGEATGGIREFPVGRTPGPINLAVEDLPATLVFRLPGYRDLDRRLLPGTLTAGQPHYPEVLRLEPAIPLLVPALYGLRDYPFVVVAALFLAWLGLGWRALKRESREDARMAGRLRRGNLLPGDRLHGYLLGEPLARGGMSRVFCASRADDVAGERLVVKVLHRGPARAPERFAQEINACRGLRHPNIVFLVDWGEVEGNHYLVMEYVPGRPLEEHLQKQRPTVAETLRWAADVARALQAAHAAGIVHRDIKPSNIMITPSGRARVMDFGIARPEAAGRLTAAGTPGYMSPEQIRGEPCEWRTDLYSLGVVLYRCLAGKHPFPGRGPLHVLGRQQEGRYTPLEDLEPEVGRPLRDLVHRLMDKSPSRRAADQGQVLRELEALAASEPIERTQCPPKPLPDTMCYNESPDA